MSETGYILLNGENPQLDDWFQLGEFDPTRLSLDHERSLVRYLLSIGATAGLIIEEGRTRFRCLISPIDPRLGIHALGFMASPDSSFLQSHQPIFETMLETLAARFRIRRFVGPMNGMTWFTYRLRVDSEARAYPWEPRRFPLLQQFLEKHGFITDAHYHTTCSLGFRRFIAEIADDSKRVTAQGIRLQRLHPERLSPAQLLEIYELSLRGFAENYLFSPISFEAFISLYLAGKSDKPTYLYAATHEEQRIIAYALGFLEGKTLTLKTATTDPSYRKQGISNALFHAMAQDLPSDVDDTYISALVFKSLASESYAKHGEALWVHQYILLSRSTNPD